MTTETRVIKQLDKSKQFNFWAAASLVLVIFISFQAQAKAKAKPQNIAAKGKEGAAQTSKQKSSKKFALKKPLKVKSETKIVSASPKKAKTVSNAKSNAKSTTKSVAKLAAKTKFVIAKAPVNAAPVKEEPSDMFKAFSSNQQNQLIVQNSKPNREVHLKSKKMPSLLPTSSNDSQRAASMLEADSGVHGDDGYTRTQIVDAPVRKPAAVASPKTPERVAITFEHETK